MERELNFLQEPDALDGPEMGAEGNIVQAHVRRPSSVRTIVVWMLVLFLALGALIVFVSAGRFAHAMLETRDALSRAQAHTLQMDFTSAQHEAHIASSALAVAQSQLWLVTWTYPIPYVGDQAQALAVLVETGATLVNLLTETLTMLEDVFFVMQEVRQTLEAVPGLEHEYSFSSMPEHVRVEMLRTISRLGPELANAQTKLVFAQEQLLVLEDTQLIGGLSEVVARLRDGLPQVVSALELITPFAQSIHAFAGVEQDAQWLLLFLNNTEMRPGGGFMGVYGLLQVSDGEIVNLTTQDTYSIDWRAESEDYVVEPPFAISQYLGLDTWYFRDANWYPDFAESSKAAMQLLRQEYAFAGEPVPEIHGVLGITPTVVEHVLRVTGDITVDGITFTPENFTETLEWEVEYGFKERGIAWEDRKAIINDLTDVLVERLQSLPLTSLLSLTNELTTLFEQKYMALYSVEEEVQSVFVDAGWAGVLSDRGVDDVLMIVDANMGALKTDHAMEKDIHYSIEPVEGGYEATVDITYTNNGSFDWRTTRYRSYTSVLAPLGSELIYTSGQHASSLQEGGFERMSSFISLEPGEVGTLRFVYRLPEQVHSAMTSDTYRLRVFKQIGSKPSTLTVDLNFGKTLRAADPSEQPKDFGDLSYRVERLLDQNRDFIIQF